jgi:hypothetical protein
VSEREHYGILHAEADEVSELLPKAAVAPLSLFAVLLLDGMHNIRLYFEAAHS